ncbi:hypothetical protein H2200_013350 [Cladophialophora chaetospira]|uniref:Beta-xylosidase C-terminal Concanavalin A-like domain-containing protein n=1 Tax=Cladophialophora chaetospira TaxID=386627 RepID=A0AA38WW46_9EURO|nr:hypothetical protein H2200_013350 [Cladophialophora chaetospira]
MKQQQECPYPSLGNDRGCFNCYYGPAIYKDDFRYARIYQDSQTSDLVLEVVNKAKDIENRSRKECRKGEDIELQLEYKEDSYTFSFGIAGETTKFDTFDTLDLVGPDFTGPIIGVFSTCSEEESSLIFPDLKVA